MIGDLKAPPMKRKANTKANRTPNTLVLTHPLHAKGKTDAELTADAAIEGIAANALLLQTWSKYPLGTLDITALMSSLDQATAAVNRGEMAAAESLLMAQAIALNTIFVNLAARGHQATLLDHLDKHMRLAFKAQAQCRATLETLAVLKNPPVFARQANISSGPQQVNNGPVLNAAPTRAAILESEPNRVLEGVVDDERVDGRAKGTASTGNQAMATLGAIDGTTHASGQDPRITQRLSRRRTPHTPRLRERGQRADTGAAGRD